MRLDAVCKRQREHDQEMDVQWSEVARYTVEDRHLAEMQDMVIFFGIGN